MNYYNDIEPYVCKWLENLIVAKLIPEGKVDDRSIKDVRAPDLKGFTQCHFFAGIAGWPRALQLAGWPGDRKVWTGSCPCQPFSVAGKRQGSSDDRHLWPYWFELIRQCHPPIIFGEQVSSAIAHGWLDEVYQGLEGEGYAIGASVLPACGIGAPHRRDRLWFVADADSSELWNKSRRNCGQKREDKAVFRANGPATSLGHAQYQREGRWRVSGPNESIEKDEIRTSNKSCRSSKTLAYTQGQRLREEGPNSERSTQWPSGRSYVPNPGRGTPERYESSVGALSQPNFWEFEPDVGRVANGVSARVDKLRALGNAIVPQVAQAFVTAFLQSKGTQ